MDPYWGAKYTHLVRTRAYYFVLAPAALLGHDLVGSKTHAATVVADYNP
jgi:hypothetical protein